eukprot:4553631-Pyramimonas_sp.AAC.1
MTIDQANVFLDRLPQRYRSLGVLRHAKHLGVEIGPDGHIFAWGEATAGFQSRARTLRNMGLGLATTIAMFSSTCLSVLCCILQFYAPSKKVFRACSASLQLLAAAFRASFSNEMLRGLRTLWLPTEFPSLVHYARAVHLRALITCPSSAHA